MKRGTFELLRAGSVSGGERLTPVLGWVDGVWGGNKGDSGWNLTHIPTGLGVRPISWRDSWSLARIRQAVKLLQEPFWAEITPAASKGGQSELMNRAAARWREVEAIIWPKEETE